MSLQYLKENSFSDSKMDISDATTSVESAGVSPEYESKTHSQSTHIDQVVLSNNFVNNDERDLEMRVDEDRSSPINPTRNETQNDYDQNLANSLDNRFKLPIVSKISIENNVNHRQLQLQQSQQRNVTRTLANSHPLMSPPGTDSDSEQSKEQSIGVGVGGVANGHKYQRSTHFNFPDVVPASEHHQANNKVIGPTAPAPAPHNKVSILRTHSLDLLSSESEADVSQYHAAVEANLQSVALISNTPSAITDNGGSVGKVLRSMRTRKNGCDDISSLDSISNHSFDDDEDIEHNLASLSPTSSLADGLDDYDDDDVVDVDDECDENGSDLFIQVGFNEIEQNESLNATICQQQNVGGDIVALPTERATAVTPSPILPQYSAAEERRNSRNWQKITLPDGRMFEIDMRVIEPYKRVLSHGGYLKAGGHNAIVIFSACHLPDRSRADYSYVMDNLFLYVVKTLEQLVTDDYVLIYLHGGCNRRNVPPFPWLKKCYQLLDRRLRKSLKNMYLVHPTFWVKSIVWMARPFVSVKFWRKLIYVKSLEELSKHVSVERAAIPEKVKQYDAKHT